MKTFLIPPRGDMAGDHMKKPCAYCAGGVCDWCKGKRVCGCNHHNIRQIIEKDNTPDDE